MRRNTRNVATMGFLAILGTVPGQLLAQSGSAAVSTTMSTYLAGGNVYTAFAGGGGGIAPVSIALTPGTGRVLRVDASGTGSFCAGPTCITPNPDGPAIGGTNLNASGKISGIVAPTSGFLAGLFLGPALPASAPASLDFNALTTDFGFLAPLLGQQFFVGNGFTSGSVQQLFFVPDGATSLYFGIADGFSFGGDPGFYEDNAGEYTARYSITGTSVVPEPSSIALIATGLAALLVVRRRRAA